MGGEGEEIINTLIDISLGRKIFGVATNINCVSPLIDSDVVNLHVRREI